MSDTTRLKLSFIISCNFLSITTLFHKSVPIFSIIPLHLWFRKIWANPFFQQMTIYFYFLFSDNSRENILLYHESLCVADCTLVGNDPQLSLWRSRICETLYLKCSWSFNTIMKKAQIFRSKKSQNSKEITLFIWTKNICQRKPPGILMQL